MQRRCALPFIIVLLVGFTGCTEQVLKQSTVGQARTINDIQFQQVLQNIAMFKEQSDSLPWSVVLAGGQVSVTDGLTAGYNIAVPQHGVYTQTPSVGGSRQWAEQWTIAAVNDPVAIIRLQKLYQWTSGIYTDTAGTHIWTSKEDPKAWDGYRTALATEIQGPNDQNTNLSPELLPLPSSNWINTEQPASFDYCGSFGKTTIWVTHDHVKDLTHVAIFVMKITAPTTQNKGFLIGNVVNPGGGISR